MDNPHHFANERQHAYRNGVRAAIEWLHRRAGEMNDSHAKAVLNTAAFNLGVDLAQGHFRGRVGGETRIEENT